MMATRAPLLRPKSAAPSPIRRPARRRFEVETLESRRLLSTMTPAGYVEPSVAELDVSALVSSPNPVASALTPAQVRSAYGINTSATTGAGITVAIVSAYHDPNIVSDLATFSKQYGLPAANLTVVNQSGQTTNLPRTVDGNWALETAMDVEWVHAAAPGAKLVLVEANSTSNTDMMAAVQTAARLANVVSMSWGGSEYRGQTAYDTAAYFANSSVTFVAASGDDGGASGVLWPASSPYVVSVGGTTLTVSGTTYAGETAWSSSGSRRSASGSTGGVSTIEAFPSYQSTALGASYARGRVTPDVSIVGNPSTGVSVYSSVTTSGQSGWFKVGGTSAGAPIWSGIIAAADAARVANRLTTLNSTQTLSLLYALYGSGTTRPASYAASFHDILSGSNFAGSARAGYDMVTGLGSPIASSIVLAAAGYSTSAIRTASLMTTTTVAAANSTALVNRALASIILIVSVDEGGTAEVITLTVIPPPLANTQGTAAVAASTNTNTNVSVATAGSLLTASAARPAQSATAMPSGLGLGSSLGANEDSPWLAPPKAPRPVPGFFLDPEPTESGEPGDLAPMLTQRFLDDLMDRDAAIQLLSSEWFGDARTEAGDISQAPAVAAPVPVETPEDAASEAPLGAAPTAGAVLVLWGIWEYRSRRSDRDRDRRRQGPAALRFQPVF